MPEVLRAGSTGRTEKLRREPISGVSFPTARGDSPPVPGEGVIRQSPVTIFCPGRGRNALVKPDPFPERKTLPEERVEGLREGFKGPGIQSGISGEREMGPEWPEWLHGKKCSRERSGGLFRFHPERNRPVERDGQKTPVPSPVNFSGLAAMVGDERGKRLLQYSGGIFPEGKGFFLLLSSEQNREMEIVRVHPGSLNGFCAGLPQRNKLQGCFRVQVKTQKNPGSGRGSRTVVGRRHCPSFVLHSGTVRSGRPPAGPGLSETDGRILDRLFSDRSDGVFKRTVRMEVLQ